MKNQGIVSELMALYRLARQSLATISRRCRNLGETNHQMGLQFLAEGKPANAAFRFRMASLLDKTQVDALFQLGLYQLSGGQKKQAEASFSRALAVNPGHTESRYFLGIIAPGALPEKSKPTVFPESLIIERFTSMASGYEEIRAQEKYCGHILTAEALHRHKSGQANDYHVLDAGCGTGIASAVLKPLCTRLTGIDITPAMAQIATTHTEYDKVLTGDVMRHLCAQTNPLYHAIIFSDVLGYIGALDTVFSATTKVLHPGGLLIFTADIGEAAEFGLSNKLARFTHSENHLRALAKASKLAMLELTHKDIGTEQFSLLGVCRKAG